MNHNLDIRTPHRKRLDKRRQKICEMFLRLKAENSEAKQNSIIRAMVTGRLTTMSHSAIREILIRNGVYKLKNQQQ